VALGLLRQRVDFRDYVACPPTSSSAVGTARRRIVARLMWIELPAPSRHTGIADNGSDRRGRKLVPGLQTMKSYPAFLPAENWKLRSTHRDVALRRCPVTRLEAQAMIAEVNGVRLLQGFRGRRAADLKALADTWCACRSSPCTLKDTLAELDINPLMVLPRGRGVKAVEVLVVLRGV